jgi:hypothetical protein
MASPLRRAAPIVAPPQIEVRRGADGATSAVAALVPFRFEAPDAPIGAHEIDGLVARSEDAAAIRKVHAPQGRGEVVVIGSAWAPEGRHATQCLVRLRLGKIDKSVYVVGDRFWRGSEATPPQPFRAMPIDRRHAFGGAGSKQNPGGKGLVPLEIDGRRIHPLPNVQVPGKVIMAPGDATPLAGLGPLPERALSDQWVDTALRHGEPFVIENMHPTQATLEGRLPRIACRAFEARGEELTPVALAFECVWLFPGAGAGVAVHRGLAPAAGADAWLVALELASAPKGDDHYRDAWRRRQAGEDVGDEAWLPAGVAPSAPPPETIGASHRRRAEANRAEVEAELLAEAESSLAEARERIAAMGLDPSSVLPATLPPSPPPPAPPSPIELRAQLEVQRAKTERLVVERLAAMGRADARTARDRGPALPRFSGAAVLDRVRAAVAQGAAFGEVPDAIREKIDAPGFAATLAASDGVLAAHYRRTAHRHPRFAPDHERGRALRAAVSEARAAGESLAGRDLAGADLRGLDLSGADLRGALLECASLGGANLAGADLGQAVLAHADATGADLRGARLVDANLGGARLVRARLDGADLGGAIVVEADLEHATREGATWTTDPTGLGALRSEVPAALAAMPPQEELR